MKKLLKHKFCLSCRMRDSDVCHEDYCALNILTPYLELIDRDTAKKPDSYEWDKDRHEFTECCPNCGDSWNMNEYGSGMKYCWECGQKIDWEEE